MRSCTTHFPRPCVAGAILSPSDCLCLRLFERRMELYLAHTAYCKFDDNFRLSVATCTLAWAATGWILMRQTVQRNVCLPACRNPKKAEKSFVWNGKLKCLIRAKQSETHQNRKTVKIVEKSWWRAHLAILRLMKMNEWMNGRCETYRQAWHGLAHSWEHLKSSKWTAIKKYNSNMAMLAGEFSALQMQSSRRPMMTVSHGQMNWLGLN